MKKFAFLAAVSISSVVFAAPVTSPALPNKTVAPTNTPMQASSVTSTLSGKASAVVNYVTGAANSAYSSASTAVAPVYAQVSAALAPVAAYPVAIYNYVDDLVVTNPRKAAMAAFAVGSVVGYFSAGSEEANETEDATF